MKPTAAPARFPYREHRTLAQVAIDEAAERRAAQLRLATGANDNDPDPAVLA